MRTAIEVAAQELGLSGKVLLSDSDMLIYGTTRATNAVVTKSTAKTAFLTTRGFRDILVLKEGGKHDPHDYSYDYPPPYIPRRYTFEIEERIDAQGNVVRPLDQNRARDRFKARYDFALTSDVLLPLAHLISSAGPLNHRGAREVGRAR
jgi:N-methylhydantoinase A